VRVLESEPCLEAWLLDVAGHTTTGNTEHHKREFLRQFSMNAHDEGVFERYFGKAVLDAARPRVRVLDQLLSLIGVS
jgi:hypothetical protein